MNLTDGDFEFVFNMYDEAQNFIGDKDKLEFANKTILHLVDFGFDVRPATKEISDHCEFLGEAMDLYLESEEEDEDIFDDDNPDDEELDY
jgi:hypothetical protein|tara:strand:- start:1920 stop:2189 length:270 start_codon:yes stop_codon:yes gene_type:complete